MGIITQTHLNYYLFETHVENLFIVEYMPAAPDGYVKVYLAGLGCAQIGRNEDWEAMARKLGCSVALIDEAWAYWEAQGIVRRVYPNASDRSNYNVEFMSIREAAFGRPSQVNVPAPVKRASLDDEELADLYRGIESATGRLLESNEPAEVASWIADYSMDPEVILLCYKYCTGRGKSNRCKYVGSILKDWKAKGLDTVSDVEEHLADMDRHYDMYRKVCRTMGFHRNPTEPEKKLMDTWFDDMGFTLEKVLEACGKTTGISNPNLNYINSILKGWYAEEHGSAEESDKNLFAKVEHMYEEDREKNRRKSEENRNEIFTRIPRVKDIVDELRTESFKLSKMVLAGNQKGVEAAKKKNAALLAEKKALLKKAGYGEDATDDIFTCKQCRDTGLLEDGKRCRCYNEKLQMVRLQLKEK